MLPICKVAGTGTCPECPWSTFAGSERIYRTYTHFGVLSSPPESALPASFDHESELPQNRYVTSCRSPARSLRVVPADFMPRTGFDSLDDALLLEVCEARTRSSVVRRPYRSERLHHYVTHNARQYSPDCALTSDMDR
jgi:hypothetical protein